MGPQSAGAEPGPACYGRGGTHPPVTDAAAVLGYLDQEYFLSGRLTLDVNAAEQAIESQIAGPLRLDTPQAAEAIVTVASEAMVLAIEEITVNQGVDPRECLLVAGGGAGGLNAVAIARALGCHRDHVGKLRKSGHKVVLASYSVGARERLAGPLHDHGLKTRSRSTPGRPRSEASRSRR